MIDDPVLRWLVTALLAAGAVGYGYVLVAQRRTVTYAVKQVSHLAMAVAMIAMVWPVGMAVPAGAPIVVFLLAAVWFAVTPCGSGRLASGYHAAMTAAMAWMYAVMDTGSWAEPRWVATVNWAVATGFTAATLWWLYRSLTRRGVALLCEVFTGAGAAVMFGAML